MKKVNQQPKKLYINRQTVSTLNPANLAGVWGGKNTLVKANITETISQAISCYNYCPTSFPPRCASDVL